MLDVKTRSVTIRERDLSAGVKNCIANGGKLCKGEKTQTFAQKPAVTASYGNITVCEQDALSARTALGERLLRSKQHNVTRAQIQQMVNQPSS